MRKIVRRLIIAGHELQFQNCNVRKNGGEIVQFIMGNPKNEDEKPVQVGDVIPFKGYLLSLDRVLIPNGFDISASGNSVYILFEDDEEYNGITGHVENLRFYQSEKLRVYEDITIHADLI